MSQRKVDEYKEEKKGRKERVAKEKKVKRFWSIFGPILALVIIAGLGALVYYLPTLTEKAQQAIAASDADAGVSGNEVDYDELMRLVNEANAEKQAEDAGTTETPAE